MESTISAIREFWTGAGRQIVSSFLENKGLRDFEQQDDKQNLAALYNIILDQMIDKMVASFTRGGKPQFR
jgi:hypothetical protein